MAQFETPYLPEPKAVPNYLAGAASPLWAYYGAAAVGGVAFWWMTRWAQPANLEALFATAAPVVEAAEAVAELPAAVVEAAAEIAVVTAPELPPVAEIAPDLAAASDPAPEPVAEPEVVTLETAPEPVIEAAPEPVIEAAPEPVVEAPPEPVVEVIEAAPEPVVEAAPAPEPKPRARKAAPAAEA